MWRLGLVVGAVPGHSRIAAPRREAAATPSGEPTTVRLALDWSPNTNHTAFYVADAKGWYADAGIDLEVLPYGSTAPETILAAHQAECGISFQDALTFAVAAGAPIRSTMAILQHTAQEIAVLASSSITRPGSSTARRMPASATRTRCRRSRRSSGTTAGPASSTP